MDGLLPLQPLSEAADTSLRRQQDESRLSLESHGTLPIVRWFRALDHLPPTAIEVVMSHRLLVSEKIAATHCCFLSNLRNTKNVPPYTRLPP